MSFAAQKNHLVPRGLKWLMEFVSSHHLTSSARVCLEVAECREACDWQCRGFPVCLWALS